MAERLDNIYALLVTIQLNMQENFTFLNNRIDDLESNLNEKFNETETTILNESTTMKIKLIKKFNTLTTIVEDAFENIKH